MGGGGGQKKKKKKRFIETKYSLHKWQNFDLVFVEFLNDSFCCSGFRRVQRASLTGEII